MMFAGGVCLLGHALPPGVPQEDPVRAHPPLGGVRHPQQEEVRPRGMGRQGGSQGWGKLSQVANKYCPRPSLLHLTLFISRLLEKAPGFEFNRPRYLTAKVKTEDNPEETLFYLTCIHLGKGPHQHHIIKFTIPLSVVPKHSDLRQEEILRISDDLSPLFDKNTPQVS